jgi:autotransporter-associated beta strand protein
MALRYFDRNGTLAGFGTLNGNWDTTLAYWSTSSAGTATPAAFTFTAEDTAQFGFSGTAGTAGTATITVPTVTLNKIVHAGLGTQIITRSSTNVLVLAKTAANVLPVLDMQSTGSGVRFQTPVNGSDGFVKEGGNFAYFEATAGLTGLVTINAGFVIIGFGTTGTPNFLDSVTSYDITTSSGAAGLGWQGGSAVTFAKAFTGPATQNVDAYLAFYNAGGITLSDNASVEAWKGSFYLQGDTAIGALAIVNVIPTNASRLWFRTYQTGSTQRITNFTLASSGGTVVVPVVLEAQAAGTGTIHTVTDNSSGATSWTGGASLLTGSNTSATQTLRLAGSNTSASFASNILQAASRGVMALSKAGAGKWIVNGANTYTGTTTVAEGTLSAQSSGALGPDSSALPAGGAISVTGGTLELAGGITLDKSGLNISTVTTASPTNAFQVPVDGGDNTLEVGSITLNSTIRVEVGTGGALRLANTSAISGLTFGITKEGAGELDLNAASNIFTGAVSVNAGTLTVSTGVSASTNGPLGNASSAVAVSGTLKFDGTSNSNINRSVQLTGSTPALEASGTGHIHFSNVSQASGSRTLTLKGTSTTTNQLQSALGNGSGGTTSLTKDGAGQWLVTGTPSYTGATTVNAGTLDFGGQTLSLSGGVAMAGGTLANGNIGDTLVSAVTFTGGTVIALLDSTSTVTATSGTGRLQPLTVDGSNSYTGNTTVQSGATLELVTDANPGVVGDGKVTGASNVTVTGTLATGSGVNQRGQCRYGGNLTFAAGSVLAIGAAA